MRQVGIQHKRTSATIRRLHELVRSSQCLIAELRQPYGRRGNAKAGGTHTMSLFDLKGSVALVTGGNGGIGLGMARGMAGAGANIVIAGRNAEKSKAAAAELAKLGVKTAVRGGRGRRRESLQGGGGEDRQAARPPRHPRQQRRHEHPQAARAVFDGRVAPDPRPSTWTAPSTCSQAAYPAHEEGGRRQDHQHRLDDVDLRRALLGRPTRPPRAASCR